MNERILKCVACSFNKEKSQRIINPMVYEELRGLSLTRKKSVVKYTNSTWIVLTGPLNSTRLNLCLSVRLSACLSIRMSSIFILMALIPFTVRHRLTEFGVWVHLVNTQYHIPEVGHCGLKLWSLIYIKVKYYPMHMSSAVLFVVEPPNICVWTQLVNYWVAVHKKVTVIH